jgi:hypothetical protein
MLTPCPLQKTTPLKGRSRRAGFLDAEFKRVREVLDGEWKRARCVEIGYPCCPLCLCFPLCAACALEAGPGASRGDGAEGVLCPSTCVCGGVEWLGECLCQCHRRAMGMRMRTACTPALRRWAFLNRRPCAFLSLFPPFHCLFLISLLLYADTDANLVPTAAHSKAQSAQARTPWPWGR